MVGAARNAREPPVQELEEKIAHLMRTVDELSDVVARQENEIATLTRRVHMLMQREGEREAQGTGGVVLGDERPPHY
jgi:SlyX protein